ncbi:phage tail terminator protein [Vreelandella sulfidaeris]
MIEKAIIDCIKASPIAVNGIPTFFNFIPDTAHIAIMIDTPIPGFEIDHELPGYYKDVIEVVVRHSDPKAGFDLCREAMQVLNVVNRVLGDYHFNYVRPTNEPTAYPVSKGGLREFAVRFEFSCYRVDQTI